MPQLAALFICGTRNRLWVCSNPGPGAFSLVDEFLTGKKAGKPVALLRAFTRGLDFYGQYAFIGPFSQVARSRQSYSGIPHHRNASSRRNAASLPWEILWVRRSPQRARTVRPCCGFRLRRWQGGLAVQGAWRIRTFRKGKIPHSKGVERNELLESSYVDSHRRKCVAGDASVWHAARKDSFRLGKAVRRRCCYVTMAARSGSTAGSETAIQSIQAIPLARGAIRKRTRAGTLRSFSREEAEGKRGEKGIGGLAGPSARGRAGNFVPLRGNVRSGRGLGQRGHREREKRR